MKGSKGKNGGMVEGESVRLEGTEDCIGQHRVHLRQTDGKNVWLMDNKRADNSATQRKYALESLAGIVNLVDNEDLLADQVLSCVFPSIHGHEMTTKSGVLGRTAIVCG